MTVQVKEIQASRKFGGSQDKRVANRELVVYDDDGDVALTKGQVEANPNVPQALDSHPDDPRLRVKTPILIDAIDERKYTWRVRLRYEPLPVGTREVNEKGEDEIGFLKTETNSQGLFIDAWRVETENGNSGRLGLILGGSNRNNPTKPDATWSNITDALGYPIDSAGKPASKELSNTTITVTQVVAAPLTATLYDSLTNRRSMNPIAGFEAGKALYMGARSSQIAIDKFRVKHSFRVDEWYHLRQIVQRDANGNPHIASASESSDYVGRGWKVTWVQPFPLTADFRVLGI